MRTEKRILAAALLLSLALSAGCSTETGTAGTQEAAETAAAAETTADPAADTAAENAETAADSAESTEQTETAADSAESTEQTEAAADSAESTEQTEAAADSAAESAETAGITLAQAEAIALADAGFAASDVTIYKSRLEEDDGIQVYDIEFYTADGMEYDYEISASTGKILDFDAELEERHAAGAAAETGTAEAGITLEQAETIALDQAGLQASDVTFTKEKLDTKDGVYELEFRTADQSEYECEIDTATGEILSWDFEAGTAGASGSAVTADEARALALAQVPGATESSFTEFKSDYENGRLIYEGEIVFGGMEYEFEIDADTGAFLSWESDRAD